MFEIRVICDPKDVTSVSTALTLTFKLTSRISDQPARDGKRRRLYTEANHRTVPPVQCGLCGEGIQRVGHTSSEGWWVHAHMDTPDHEAVPAVWKNGDRLMETIAAAVLHHCRTDANGLVHAAPQDIAAVAASIARLLPDA